MSSVFLYTASALGLAVATVALGGYALVSRKPQGPPTVTLVVALPIEHYQPEFYDGYKRDKHILLQSVFGTTAGQVALIKEYTQTGVEFEKAKGKFEKLGADHAHLWKGIIVTFDRAAQKYANENKPAVVVSYGDSVAYMRRPNPFLVRQITLSPVVPVKYMEHDTAFTRKLYEAMGAPFDLEDGVDTDRVWAAFGHPKVREILDRERTALQ
jgi:hypothetical protein